MPQKTSPATITTEDHLIYYLMTEDDVINEIKKVCKDINEILSLPSLTLVRLLLNHFRWDKDRLTEKYFEDSEALFKLINVANPYLSPSIQWNPTSPACVPASMPIFPTGSQTVTEGNIICRTCYCEKRPNETYALRCRHQHCLTCWQQYLAITISNHANQEVIFCLSRCNQIIDDEEILSLISHDEPLLKSYRKILIESYVATNRLTRWCPGNGCTTIVKLRTLATKLAPKIECDSCNTAFCYQCAKPWHEPLQCSVLQKWEQKNQDESMTGKWIIANTKECPKCKTNIEKNGGCNHMTCRKAGCGHEFCWLCFGDWRGHQQCNVFRQTEIDNNQSDARTILARYMHYYTRYETHHQSLQFEEKLREQIEERKREMVAESMSYTEQQAIDNGFRVLQACRRTLKYTYPFAFYLERSNMSEIFEQNQADLEKAIEVLSGFLEKEIEATENVGLKLMNHTHFCDHRRQILVKHCKDGYAKNEWPGLDSI